MLSDREYINGYGVKPQSCILPLIIANAVLFALCQLGDFGTKLEQALILHPYYLKHFEIWRLVTYMFLHGGLVHIAANMWGLYMFGSLLEKALGYKRFLILYFVSGIIGALLWVLCNYNAESLAIITKAGELYQCNIEDVDQAVVDGYRFIAVNGGCVGASGAIFGVLIATAMAFPNVIVRLIFPPVSMKMRTMVIIYIIYEIFQSFDSNSNVAHLAHLGGALGGFLYMNRLRRPSERGFFKRLGTLFGGRRTASPKAVENHLDLTPEEIEFLRSDKVRNAIRHLSTDGYDALTDEERMILAQMSEIQRKHSRKQ